ncbi:MAG: hypothetical protein PHE55_00160, partial [Methylococcaceae bacterium]|nr:hypothetical protein [Methylococcaceae bacterium]
AKRGDGLYFSKLEAGLKHCPQVQTVHVNARAASILIICATDESLDSIGDFAREQSLFDLRSEQAPPLKTLGEQVAAQINNLDQALATGSRGHLDLQSIFFLLFLGLGLRQMWRGQIMQPAIPLLWRAMEILKDLK